MAEEKKLSPAKVFLRKHGEKVGLGVAAAALLGYLLFFVVMAKEDTTSQDMRREEKRINVEKDRAHKEQQASEVKVEFGPILAPWNVVTTAKAGGDAVARALPEVTYNEIAKVVARVKAAAVPPIAFGTTAVDFDGITLTWKVIDFTKLEMTKGQYDFDFFKIASFLIEREANGSGKWEKLAEVEAKILTYKDSNISPKTKYAYRISSVPEPDTNAKREKKAEGMTIGPPSSLATQGIWKLTFTTPSKPAGSAKGMVWVKIEKYEKGRGTVDKSHIHYEGDRLGWWEEQAGAEPVSLHRISKDGKAFSVDFNTGYNLVSVEPKRLMLDFKKCRKKYVEGNWVGCDQIVEKRPFSTNEIVFTDEEGEKKILVPNPQESNDLCENHGGTKREVKGPDAKGPDQPKEDPKVVEARKREEAAAKLFADAEKDENAKNKSQAAAKYNKLLSDFAETDFVSKQKLEVIKERLARLK